MKRVLLFSAIVLAVVSVTWTATQMDNAYCCPGQENGSMIMTVVTRTHIVKYTKMVKTATNIIGYKDCPFGSRAVKRFFISGSQKWENQDRGSGTAFNKKCPIYRHVFSPITQYKVESFEKPVYTKACRTSELVCCKGFVRTKTGICQSGEDVAKLKDKNVKNILDFIGY